MSYTNPEDTGRKKYWKIKRGREGDPESIPWSPPQEERGGLYILSTQTHTQDRESPSARCSWHKGFKEPVDKAPFNRKTSEMWYLELCVGGVYVCMMYMCTYIILQAVTQKKEFKHWSPAVLYPAEGMSSAQMAQGDTSTKADWP